MKFLKFLAHLVAALFILCLLMGPLIWIESNGYTPIRNLGIGMCIAILPLFCLMCWLANYVGNYWRDVDGKNRKGVYSYDQNTATLTIYKRCKQLKKVVYIQKFIGYSEKFHPSETVYTGVTVGGIHTGGFHQTEASLTKTKFRTDKATLRYFNEYDTNSGQIKIIKLDPSLVDDARRCFPSMLNGDCLVLSHPEEKRNTLPIFNGEINVGQGELTLTECKYIREWISGE